MKSIQNPWNTRPTRLDKKVFNLRHESASSSKNLMNNGIRDATGSHVGKSIIFRTQSQPRDHLSKSNFFKLFPQYGGKFCKVIDNYEPRADELIEEFKKPDSGLNIAVSVDMMDTGIDVPEVVNLVFAKPVYLVCEILADDRPWYSALS